MIIKLIKDVNSNEISCFDCGSEELNIFLKHYAKQNDNNRLGRTFVFFDDNGPIGFVTLCSASIAFSELPKNYKLPRYPIPAIRIARLAVDKHYQGQGYGKELLSFSLEKMVILAEYIGVKFVIVEAKEESKTFYEYFGFVSLPNNKNTYILPIDTLAKAYRK